MLIEKGVLPVQAPGMRQRDRHFGEEFLNEVGNSVFRVKENERMN
jgi:hypothetical protein